MQSTSRSRLRYLLRVALLTHPRSRPYQHMGLNNATWGCTLCIMAKVRYIHWRDGDMWIGYLEDWPDYMTQGETETELEENLKDIYKDLADGQIPGARKVAELSIP